MKSLKTLRHYSVDSPACCIATELAAGNLELLLATRQLISVDRYDARDNVISRELHDDGELVQLIKYDYDDAGRLMEEQWFAAGSELPADIPAQRHLCTYQPDGRMIAERVLYADGSIIMTTHEYDDVNCSETIVSTSDELGTRKTLIVSDGEGREIRREEWEDETLLSGITRTYDASGNEIEWLEERGNSRSTHAVMTYDADGNCMDRSQHNGAGKLIQQRFWYYGDPDDLTDEEVDEFLGEGLIVIRSRGSQSEGYTITDEFTLDGTLLKRDEMIYDDQGYLMWSNSMYTEWPDDISGRSPLVRTTEYFEMEYYPETSAMVISENRTL
ncbi:MAG: hypothetical protein ABI876_02875 [Bacteroidota bacterium]